MENKFKNIINNFINRIRKIGLKKLILYLIISVIVIAIFVIIGNLIEKKIFENNVKNKTYSSSQDFKTPREYIVYSGNEYIKEEKSNEKDIDLDIYLKFKLKTCENGKSNETLYNDVVNVIAQILNYSSFRLIDENQQLEIIVQCDSVKKIIKNTYYNGDENYFEKIKSMETIKEYKERKNREFEIQSKILNNLIQQEWKTSKIDLGEKIKEENNYSIYNNYMIKNAGKKIFNIVFFENYESNIVNNLKVNSKKDYIVQVLGNPDFEFADIIGYRGNEFYIFFINNRVSIYRVENEQEGYDEFLKILEQFREYKNSKKLASDITDLWSDYNEYEVNLNQIDIEYALRGIKIQFNVDSYNGIIIYNNYKGEIEEGINLKDIKENSEYKIPKYIFIKANEDLVFNTEIERAFKFKEITS